MINGFAQFWKLCESDLNAAHTSISPSAPSPSPTEADWNLVCMCLTAKCGRILLDYIGTHTATSLADLCNVAQFLNETIPAAPEGEELLQRLGDTNENPRDFSMPLFEDSVHAFGNATIQPTTHFPKRSVPLPRQWETSARGTLLLVEREVNYLYGCLEGACRSYAGSTTSYECTAPKGLKLSAKVHYHMFESTITLTLTHQESSAWLELRSKKDVLTLSAGHVDDDGLRCEAQNIPEKLLASATQFLSGLISEIREGRQLSQLKVESRIESLNMLASDLPGNASPLLPIEVTRALAPPPAGVNQTLLTNGHEALSKLVGRVANASSAQDKAI
jgi:hypothetical protein